MPNLLIIGAGGHGKAVADAALESGLWHEIFFLGRCLARSYKKRRLGDTRQYREYV